MKRTLAQLADSLERKIPTIKQAASERAKKVALTILGDLLYVTPVDTSKALSNWQISIGQPVEGSIPPYYKGSKGDTQIASAGVAFAEAKRVLANKKPGQIIYLSNTLPYIRRLNEGYSAQAPAGFVERAVLLGRLNAKKEKLRL